MYTWYGCSLYVHVICNEGEIMILLTVDRSKFEIHQCHSVTNYLLEPN